MQNAEITHKDSLDLDTSLAQQSTAASLEAVHSDPGLRPKIKSRSRFSTAIRKLSGSTRKKEHSAQEASQEAFVSSGGEEPEFASTTTSLADTKEKKKSRLSKRFLLSSLSKKSKVSPKTSIDADEDNEERTAALDAFLDAEQEKSTKATEQGSSTKGAKPKQGGIPTSTGKQSKVQITISGKKAAAESPKTELKSVRSTALSGETDCPATSAETAKGKQKTKETHSELPTKALSSADAAAKAKKKLKAKKTSTAAVVSGVSTKKTKPKDTETETETEAEKLVVTHSAVDTPPIESAPSKPSRSTSASQTNVSNETPTVVRKATTRAAATVTSPSLTQRLGIGSAARAKKQSAGGEANITPATQATALQRSYRFSRPTAPPATAASTTSSAIQPATATTTSFESSTGPAIRQRQLQFQLKSDSQSKPHVSQSLTRSSIDTPLTAEPISSILAPELRSSTHSTNRQHSGLAAARISNSSGQDDFVSSAESAVHQAGYEARPTSQDWSDEATEAALQLAARSLRKQNTGGSYASNLSSSSGSRASTISRQNTLGPIMYDSMQNEATEHLTMDGEMELPTTSTEKAGKREHLYKILIIGEAGTGKTSFIKRYVHQFFSQNYRATIGVDFALKVLQWDDDTVRLQLWDIAGQERFGNMTRVYYKEAVGAFIVFDVTRSATFDCVNKWKEDLDSKVQLPNGSPIPCILLANKCDQEKQGLVAQPEKMDEFVKENGFAGWFETSAKENINIDEAARALVSKILLNDKLNSGNDTDDSGKLNLMQADDHLDTANIKKKCLC